MAFGIGIGISPLLFIDNGIGAPDFDPDAQAFITAAAITNPTQQAAINTLVVDLKGYNIWSKMKALYPFVGGTATMHKFNLKDPRDLDAAFRIFWNGGWTHSSNGATPSGSNGWANTYLTTQGSLALNSTHVSVYSRTDVDRLSPSIGNVTGGVSGEFSLWLRYQNSLYARINSSTIATPYPLVNNSTGLFIANRTSATQVNISIRGTQTTISNNSQNVYPNSFQLGGVSPNFFDTKEIAFASIGDGLTAQNMTDLTTIVNAFETALSRNV